MEEWREVAHIYTELLPGYLKNQSVSQSNLAICDNTDGLTGDCADWGKSDKDKCHVIYLHVEYEEQNKKKTYL